METASLTDAWRRKLWRGWWDAHDAWLRAGQQRRQKALDAVGSGQLSTAELQQALLGPNNLGSAPPFPEACRSLACGAKTKRRMAPCLLTRIYRNGRCKFHGGMSSGPRTPEGKRKAAANGLRPKRERTS